MKVTDLNIDALTSCMERKILPGLSSQLKMAPVTRLGELLKSQKQTGQDFATSGYHKKSAVLVLLYPKNDLVYLAMMVRAIDDTIHSGQVSFPGGSVEKSDLSIEHTALREAWEEIGVDPETVNVIGQLTKLYIHPSNFDVFPIVGIAGSTPVFMPNQEVRSLLEVNIDALLDSSASGYKQIAYRTGDEFVVPCYYINNEVVWGATAMILSEFLDVMRNALLMQKSESNGSPN